MKNDNRSVRFQDFIMSMSDWRRLKVAIRKYEHRVHISKFKAWRKENNPRCDDPFCMNDGCEANHVGFFQFKEMFRWILSLMVLNHREELSAMIRHGRLYKWIPIHEGSEIAKLVDLVHSEYPRDPAKSQRVGVVQLSYLCKKSHSFETFNDRLQQKRVEETIEPVFFYKDE